MDILGDLGITAIITTGAFFILRKFIELNFSKDLEKFKGDLQRESIKYKTTYENLHTERAKIIKEIYQKIVDTQLDFESLMKPFQPVDEAPQDEKAKKAVLSFNNLITFFLKNEIYFDKQLASDLNNFISNLKENWKKFNTFDYSQQKPFRDIEEWSKAWDYMQKEIPKLKDDIANKFRKIIGIEDN